MTMLKAALHCHTSEDPKDTFITYSADELIDEAKRQNFDVLAITLHNKVHWSKDLEDYAASKNILLIPGIEQSVDGGHTLILNAHREAEDIKTFADLEQYRKDHPECFVIAAHPYYPIDSHCHGNNLEKKIHLFDGIEWSHFYRPTLFHYCNRRAKQVAGKHKKPLIATPDCHIKEQLPLCYTLIDTHSKERTKYRESPPPNNAIAPSDDGEEGTRFAGMKGSIVRGGWSEWKTIPTILTALRNGHFQNHTRPLSIKEFITICTKMLIWGNIKKALHNWKHK